MGKILDSFMKKHELDDAQVLAMIGSAALQVMDPDLSIEEIKKKSSPGEYQERRT